MKKKEDAPAAAAPPASAVLLPDGLPDFIPAEEPVLGLHASAQDVAQLVAGFSGGSGGLFSANSGGGARPGFSFAPGSSSDAVAPPMLQPSPTLTAPVHRPASSNGGFPWGAAVRVLPGHPLAGKVGKARRFCAFESTLQLNFGGTSMARDVELCQLA